MSVRILTFLIILPFVAISSQLSYGLLFDAKILTDQEKGIAEKDYISIIKNCHDRLLAKIDSGEKCDAFMSFYIKQCDAFDNLLIYCNSQLEDYDIIRVAQEMCLEQNRTITKAIFCDDFLNLNAAALDESFKQIETTKPHVTILGSQIYNNTQFADLPPYIMGEVLNNFTYPVKLVRIFARTYDAGGNVIVSHNYTQDSYLKPGQPSGFWILLENPISKISNYTLTSEFQKSDTVLQENLRLKVISVLNDPPQISGTITNQGNETATNVKVSGIFYDANHKVVDIANKAVYKRYEFYNTIGILPGREVPFTLVPFAYTTFISGRSSGLEEPYGIKSYTLSVASSEYSFLP